MMRQRWMPWLQATLLLPAVANAGTLRFETLSPVGPVLNAARVVDAQGEMVALLRPGESGEIAPGRYLLELLTDPPLKRKIVVPDAGEVVVRFELGAIGLLVSDADGAALRTIADISLADGRRVLSLASGETRALPPATYRAVVRVSPNQVVDAVKIVALKTETVRVGLGSSLILEARGEGGKVVAMVGRLALPDGRTLGVTSGEKLDLPAGRYRLIIASVPPLERRIELTAGRTTTVRLDDLGAIRLDLRDRKGKLVAVTAAILDVQSGLVLAEGENGSSLVARPGTYRVRFRVEPLVVRDRVVVRPRAVTRVGAR